MTIQFSVFECGFSDSFAFDRTNKAVTFYKFGFDEEGQIYLGTSLSGVANGI